MVLAFEMLNDAKIKAAKPREKSYRLGDSGQLYLQVTPSGGRHWRFNYAFGKNAQGKPAQKTLSFGSYPAVTLLEARARRDEAKAHLAHGRDPAQARKTAEQAKLLASRNSFRAIADEWFELNSGWSMAKLNNWATAHENSWSVSNASNWIIDQYARWSTVHAADVLTSLERDVFPLIGHRPITDLTAREIRDVLLVVQARGAIETAHRLRQRVSAIFVYGIAVGACANDPAASLNRLLKPVPRSKPQPSIVDEHRDQNSRLAAIRQMLIDCEAERCRATTKLAMRLLALTAVRPGELAGARWDEFSDLDGDLPIWTIPAQRMKGTKDRKEDESQDQIVPLARQSVDVIRTLRQLTGRFPLCFPGERHTHRQMSENTLRALLIRAGYHQRHVPHGFRAAFSTYMNDRPPSERQDGDRAVIDLMLAHVPQASARGDTSAVLVSGSEGAYNRAAYMGRRRELAQIWADLLLADFQAPDALLGAPMRWAATGPGRIKKDL